MCIRDSSSSPRAKQRQPPPGFCIQISPSRVAITRAPLGAKVTPASPPRSSGGSPTVSSRYAASPPVPAVPARNPAWVSVARIGTSAYMHQRDLLFPWRSALDNASLGLEVQGSSKSTARERASASAGATNARSACCCCASPTWAPSSSSPPSPWASCSWAA